jgi:hypothetical protein
MRKIAIWADEALLDRARRVAALRRVSVEQLIRDALAHELGDQRPVGPVPGPGPGSRDGDAMRPAPRA